ncbi:1,4-dihydroxy-2-naphthoate octaprenyltransferase [Bifidobacterium sp. ESL0775]|uniref:1,4-dihydroxy-2-naphthoate octaprenyltransferase n=1 Tax=Bifidobacterium sp. ESL0775 TaxID=2983230 RepID=UPI0023F89BD6|nr:1,4-dihydroxy-2-naphthoate octaprenyltransferase [Bifidobacterium sp. ESL0775]WEV68963.1 1,4-dihydroxy-2-naphthoate octaprenyltransferase [Bifidobacterium sp. ESL0775]
MDLWINGLRPKTLPASIAPVLVGVVAAYRLLEAKAAAGCTTKPSELQGCTAVPTTTASDAFSVGVSSGRFALVSVLCIIIALFLQIAVNFANDYSDGIRGTDAGRGASEFQTAKPQRLTASGLVAPKQVLAAAGVNALIACLAGLAAIALTGHWWMIILGVLCLLAGWFYTGGKHPYGYAGYGEVGVFIFFGLVAVLGTQYVLTGGINIAGVIGSVLCGLYSCAILMVNNLRDVEEDKASGKMTLGVILGAKTVKTVLLVIYLLSVVLTVVFALYPLVYVLASFVPSLALFTGSVSIIRMVLTVLALLLGLLIIKIAIDMVNSVNVGNFVRALPMCSMTLLLFALIFIIAELALAW